jgi:GTP-binding protein LepA
VRVGDTITIDHDPADEPLAGYEPPRQMVFCDFYPATTGDKKGTDFEDMREAIEKLSLNDSSFTFQAVHSEALGFGFRCGFLGLLHMDIVQERLEREFDLEIVQTAPTVSYKALIRGKGGEPRRSRSTTPPTCPTWARPRDPRADLQARDHAAEGQHRRHHEALPGTPRHLQEPDVRVRRREMLTFEMPLAELIYDFYDKLKGITSGYGTMDYEVIEFRRGPS